MRYIIIFLIGFFLGGFFGGDLGLFLNKTKNIVLKKDQKEQKDEPLVITATAVNPPPRVIEIAQPEPKPVEQRVYKAVSPKTTPADREKIYSVQVASFKTREQANKFVEELIKQEYDAYIPPSRPSEPANRFRVCIGETISMEQAKSLNTKLKAKFKDSFVYEF